ncbi:MAG: iron chelate uptake ABC transporter family permease subunit [Shinella zoogloeoides]|uniref:FecCD family ABC transporter permease n=1 Tax=Shinella zoogloeoides TaxID=352475 RepID=UPI003C73810A
MMNEQQPQLEAQSVTLGYGVIATAAPFIALGLVISFAAAGPLNAVVLGASNAWMIRQVDLKVALGAAVWGAGSLNGFGTAQLVPVIFVLCLIVPPTLFLARPMRQLEMGDDTAMASGVHANRVGHCLMMLGVALTATVTAATGPIVFIALAAPQIARRLTRSAGVVLLPSALMGGILLFAADWAAQHLFSTQLPVGVMTVSIGGLYFLWLIIRESRT